LNNVKTGCSQTFRHDDMEHPGQEPYIMQALRNFLQKRGPLGMNVISNHNQYDSDFSKMYISIYLTLFSMVVAKIAFLIISRKCVAGGNFQNEN